MQPRHLGRLASDQDAWQDHLRMALASQVVQARRLTQIGRCVRAQCIQLGPHRFAPIGKQAHHVQGCGAVERATLLKRSPVAHDALCPGGAARRGHALASYHVTCASGSSICRCTLRVERALDNRLRTVPSGTARAVAASSYDICSKPARRSTACMSSGSASIAVSRRRTSCVVPSCPQGHPGRRTEAGTAGHRSRNDRDDSVRG